MVPLTCLSSYMQIGHDNPATLSIVGEKLLATHGKLQSWCWCSVLDVCMWKYSLCAWCDEFFPWCDSREPNQLVSPKVIVINNSQGAIIYLYRLEFQLTAYHSFHSSHVTAKMLCTHSNTHSIYNKIIQYIFRVNHFKLLSQSIYCWECCVLNTRAHHNAYSSQMKSYSPLGFLFYP